MRICIFDIETCFNSALLDLALKAARQRAERRGEDPGGIDPEAVKGEMSLSPIFGRIVAVGLLDADEGRPRIWVGEDERELLELFWHNAEGYDLFISFNALRFDLPWLLIRSMVNGIRPTVHISTARFRYPGESNHLDLFALLTDWRGNQTRHLRLDLKTIAQVLGVEVPAGDGAEVPKMVEAENWEGIKCHLKADLEATLRIWERLGRPGLIEVEEMGVPF